MIHLYDRAAIERAAILDLNPVLKRLLTERIAALNTAFGDLTDWTEFLVVEPGDSEDDIIRHIGFSPLVEPIEGARYGRPGFAPGWDFLSNRGGWFEMIVTFGSAFAYVLLIADRAGVPSDLLDMCREHAEHRGPSG